jgi:hypothetical protein
MHRVDGCDPLVRFVEHQYSRMWRLVLLFHFAASSHIGLTDKQKQMESIIVRKYRVLSIDSDWETTKQKQRKNESQMRIFRRIEFHRIV